MNKHVTRAAGLALALAAVAVPGVSAAGQASPTSLIDKLPKSAKLALPTSVSSMPKSIPATEKVEGFFTEIPEHLKRQPDNYKYVMISGSKEQAEARNRGAQLPGAPTCFTASYPSGGTEVNWSGSLSQSTTVQNYAKQNYGYGGQYGSVQLVRSERVVKETADKLSYEVKVAYVDAETLGVRLVSSSTTEFSLVKELPGKLKVWGTKADDQVTFLVRREKHEKERFHFGALTVMVNGSHSTSSSEGCPVTFNLKTGKGVAVSAVVQTETVLEIKGVNDDESEKPGVLSLHGALPAFGQNEARVRPVRIGFSSTWMSKDTKPVVTVSHGWAGKERTQPI
ncbi:MAG: hypothetical protein JNL21_01365 [Myxococcales bacterium]|nr:hypothetical protein [Myxococcales bacterium]